MLQALKSWFGNPNEHQRAEWLAATIKAMAQQSGIKDYTIRTTLKEFKKIKSDLKGILA